MVVVKVKGEKQKKEIMRNKKPERKKRENSGKLDIKKWKLRWRPDEIARNKKRKQIK